MPPTDQISSLPVEDLLEELIGDKSSVHNDGDHPGYYSYAYEPTAGILTVTFEADGDDPCLSTVAVFRLVGTGIKDDADL
jgi:hypothetical protein